MWRDGDKVGIETRRRKYRWKERLRRKNARRIGVESMKEGGRGITYIGIEEKRLIREMTG